MATTNDGFSPAFVSGSPPEQALQPSEGPLPESLRKMRADYGSLLDLPEMRATRLLLEAGKVTLHEFEIVWRTALEVQVEPQLYKAANHVCSKSSHVPFGTQNYEDLLQEVTKGALALMQEVPYDRSQYALSEYYYRKLAQRSFDAIRGEETVRVTRTRPDPANPDGPPIKERVRVNRYQSLPENFDLPAPLESEDAISDREFREKLEACSLRPSERDLVEAIYYRGLTLVEYAKAQGEKRDTICRRHNRMLLRLRQALAAFLEPLE